MRIPAYLSYSSMSLWEKSPDEFYLKTLSERRPPRIPQEHPAAVGSAFDAHVKAALYYDLFGANDPKYTLEALFEAQVEAQNRDWARAEGKYVFDCYILAGFYAELLYLLWQSREPPRFEFTVEAQLGDVPFLGKPDCRWVTPYGVHVIHDWKVSGYCSKSAVSPHKSYMICRDGYVGKQSKSHGTEHREFLAYRHRDFTINTTYMEAANPAWADQLSLYGWALGEKVGDEDVALSVHQIVGKPTPESRPQLRIAQYRARVKREYQLQLLDRIRRCWSAITSGHVFTMLSREDSDARCQVLDSTAAGLQSDGSSAEDYFSTTTREGYRG